MAGQIIKRGKATWLIRVFLGRDHATGKRQYSNQTVHGNKRDAEDKLVEMLRSRNSGALTIRARGLTIGDLLDGVVQDYRINQQDEKWAGWVIGNLRPMFGTMPLTSIRAQHVSDYIKQRNDAGRKNATINHELSMLRRAFSLAHRNGVIVAPPIKITALKENNTRKGFFEPHEYRALRDALPEELKPVLTFAYYTGCRKSEILNLRWEQVNLLERSIRLEVGETKNKQGRLIPLGVEELYQALTLQRAKRDQQFPGCPWVFSRGGMQILNLRKAWETACEKAGLWDPMAGKEYAEGTFAGRPTKLFHDLRRTGVRNLIRAGVPEKVAMLISGHETRSIFERYNIVDDRDIVDAMGRLDAFSRAKSGTAEVSPKTQTESWHTPGTQPEEEGQRISPMVPVTH